MLSPARARSLLSLHKKPLDTSRATMNDERGTMNLKAVVFTSSFRVHHSSFRYA
jgi:hypothetical protein